MDGSGNAGQQRTNEGKEEDRLLFTSADPSLSLSLSPCQLFTMESMMMKGGERGSMSLWATGLEVFRVTILSLVLLEGSSFSPILLQPGFASPTNLFIVANV